eukprot:TRINITY_DN72864_c0_g1_i1.p1 TRINITY_DN72864_c0_g1~~TRINITY_DN72864_c0_g1_i1.p1  ORF type:complete len:281 (+),score=68.62 TRINITY_DN72864_c0_g1_i1:38-844(+)
MVKTNAMKLFGLLAGNIQEWDNLKIKDEVSPETGEEETVLSLDDGEGFEYDIDRIQRDTYSEVFSNHKALSREIIPDDQWENIQPGTLASRFDAVIKVAEESKDEVRQLARKVRAFRLTKDAVAYGETVRNIITNVQAVNFDRRNDKAALQWETLARIAKLTNAAVYDSYPVGCIREGKINSVRELKAYLNSSGNKIISGSKQTTLKTAADTATKYNLGISAVTDIAGMTEEEALKALATVIYPDRDTIEFGGQSYSLNQYRTVSCSF